jgi:hypothetical protein
MAQIYACHAGSFPVLIKEIIDKDSYPPEGMSEPDRGVADDDAYLDDGFDDEIKDSDHIFVAHIHGEDADHFVRAARQVQSGSVWQRPSQRTRRPHASAMPSHPHYTNSKTYSVRVPLITSPNVENGITQSNSRVNLCPGFERFIQCLPKNRENWMRFWKKPWQRDSKSPIGAPVFFIKKKDGKLCFVQDYRTLNLITQKNHYPLPFIDNLIHQLKGVKYFTKLDVRWYNNVRIK